LGIFLLGMIIMTDGLHFLAGGAIRSALVRFTRSPVSGAITGAASTAILQSSSATTVAAVGFVGAGILSFPQALGIIFGANVGTTITGWLVVLVGFKLNLGTLILPIIFIGVLLKLFAKDKAANSGLALAGFGLIFVGIAMMQQGMSGYENTITPTQFPDDTWLGRLQLVAIGILITLVTQSSSAGIAASLTALFAGAINFNQAAALVIGMDVGTTVTAAMATIGGSVASRRTGLSHVIYNLCTGVGALFLLTPYTQFWEAVSPGTLVQNAELALVAFHTTFNTLGVIIVLPLSRHFAHMITKIISPSIISYTQNLDKSLLKEPGIALTAIQATIKTEFLDLLKHVECLLHQEKEGHCIDLNRLQIALNDTHAYVDRLHLEKESLPEWQQLLAAIHILDHLQRLHERCDEEEYRVKAATKAPKLTQQLLSVSRSLNAIVLCLEQNDWQQAHENAEQTRKQLATQWEPIRNAIMTDTATGQLTVPQATDKVEAIRWLQRVCNHIARITFHFQKFG